MVYYRSDYYNGYCHNDHDERIENGVYVNPTREHQAKARMAALEIFPITTTPGTTQIGETSAGILVPIDGGQIPVVASLSVKEFAKRGGSQRPGDRKAFDLKAAQERWISGKIQGLERAQQRILEYRRKADELEALLRMTKQQVGPGRW